MKTSLRCLLLAFIMLHSSAADAQPAPQVWSPPPALGPDPTAPLQPPPTLVAPARHAVWPRVRFGVGGNFTAGSATDVARGVNALVFAPGVTVDLGAQLSRSLAVYGRISGATLILLNQAALLGVVEFTPVDWFSLGSGLGWMALSSPLTELNYSPSGTSSRPTRGDWGGLAVPLIVGFNIGRRDPIDERLSVFRISLECTLGVEPSTGILGWSSSLSLGFAMM